MLALSVCVYGPGGDAGGARLARLLDAPVFADAVALRRFRPGLVIVAGPVSGLGPAAWASTRAGAAAVLAAPIGPPTPLPWWGRRYHRFLLPSQADARAWVAAGVALGRLVVVEPGPEDAERRALRAVVAESASMAGRPDASAAPG